MGLNLTANRCMLKTANNIAHVSYLNDKEARSKDTSFWCGKSLSGCNHEPILAALMSY